MSKDKPGVMPREESDARAAIFLDEMRGVPNVARACRVAGLSRQAVYARRKRDAGFAEGWEDAVAEAIARLEALAFQRAEDEDRPAAASNDMLKFLLRNWDVPRYGDSRRKPHGGDITIRIITGDGAPETIDAPAPRVLDPGETLALEAGDAAQGDGGDGDGDGG